CELERTQDGGTGSAGDLSGRNRGGSRAAFDGIRGAMGCQVRFDRQDVAAALGWDRALVRISGGDSAGDLYDQCGGVSAHEFAQGDQDARLFSQRRGGAETAVPRVTKRFQEMECVDDLAKCPESFHRALWRPAGGGMATAGTIASRAYAPKPGAPARPAIVGKACQQLAGGKNIGETLLTQNR